MTIWANTFEGGTDEVTVSAANSGGASGDAFSVVTINATASLVFDDARAVLGTKSARVATGATAGQCYLERQFAAAASFGGRWYFYFTAFPAAPATLLSIQSGSGGGSLHARLQLTTAGKLSILNAAGSGVGTMTGAIPLNAWFRVECSASLDPTTGSFSLKRFDDPHAQAATETINSSSSNFGGTADRYRVGYAITALANAGPFWIDNDKSNDTGAFPGSSVAPVPNASAGPDQDANPGAVVQLTAAASTPGNEDTTITGYSWALISGTGGTLSNAAIVNPTYTAAEDVDGSVDVWRVTVTQDDAQTDTDDMTVTVAPSAHLDHRAAGAWTREALDVREGGVWV